MTARFISSTRSLRDRLGVPLLGAALALTSLSAQTLPALPPSEETIELPSFVVTSTQDKGYLAANSVSATRIATAIADLPFSVSTFNPQFMTDIQARDLTDIARYAAGVSNGSRGFNAGDDGIMARGFQQYPVHDGFFEGGGSGGNVVVDSYNFERVEVVKGPASLLYGQINPGGTVNYITKKATDKAFADVMVQGGSYSFGRASLDVNQPIGKTLLFRFNGMWENGFENVILAKSKSTGFDPTVTWKPAKNLTVTVNYSWFKRKETPPAAFNTVIEVATPASIVTAMQASQGYKAPSAALTNLFTVDAANGINDSADLGYGVMYPGLAKNFNASGANDLRNTDLETITAEANATLGRHWVARAAFDYAWNRDTQYATGLNNAYIPPPGSLTWNGTVWATSASWNAMTTAQQQAQELAFALSLIQDPTNAQNGMPAIQPRRNRLIEDYGHSDSIELDFAGSYDLSWVKLKPLIGAYYDASYEYIITRVQTPSATNLGQSYWAPWDLNPVTQALDGFVVNRDTPRVDFTTLPGQTLASLTQLGFTTDEAVYGTINAGFFKDRLLTVAGVRYNRSNGLTQSLLPGAVYVPGIKGLHDLTPQVGVGYKIRRDLMVYASYSESYIVNGTSLNALTTNPTTGAVTVAPTKQAVPTTSAGEEAGIKTDFLNGRISSSIAVYKIYQKNSIQNTNVQVSGQTLNITTQGNKFLSQGVELETTFSPTDNFQVYASVSEDDARNKVEPVGQSYYVGEPVQGDTKTLANLWARYNVATGSAKGLWLAGGFNYNGRQFADNKNVNNYLPAYWLFNSVVGYDWTMQKVEYSARLNWQNMTDKFYLPAIQMRGLPERVVVSLGAHF